MRNLENISTFGYKPVKKK